MKLYIFENKTATYKHHSSKAILNRLAQSYDWGQLTYSQSGKPYIENGYISVTHTKNILVIVHEDFPIGIDCEFPRPISDHLIKRLNLDPLYPIKDWCKLEAWIKLDDDPNHLTQSIP